MEQASTMSEILLQFPSLAVVLFAVIVFLYMFKAKASKLPPGPWKLPVIGNMHQLIGSPPYLRFRDLSKRFGPVMRLKLGEVLAIIISSPEAATQVLKTHDLNFSQRPLALANEILSFDHSSLFVAPYGNYWRQMRKICVLELLSSKRVQSFKSIREEEVWTLIESISSSQGLPINLSKKIFSMVNDITAKAAFGQKCKDQDEFLSLLREASTLAGSLNLADLFPSLKFLRSISRMKPALENVGRRLDRILDRIINDHQSRRRTGTGDHTPREEDLVDVFLNLQESGTLEFEITSNNIKGVIMDMFIAGSDTASIITEWAMSEMLSNPRIIQKAQDEVRRVLQGKTKIEESDIQELEYLKLVIKETLRLHPPVPLVGREALETCEINGYVIPKKSQVMVNVWAMSRDPEYWTDPDCFQPERFLNRSITYKGADFEFIPFGSGRRMCPGISFGISNIELPLAQLLYHFDWKLANGDDTKQLDMTVCSGFVLRKKNDLELIAIPCIPYLSD